MYDFPHSTNKCHNHQLSISQCQECEEQETTAQLENQHLDLLAVTETYLSETVNRLARTIQKGQRHGEGVTMIAIRVSILTKRRQDLKIACESLWVEL